MSTTKQREHDNRPPLALVRLTRHGVGHLVEPPYRGGMDTLCGSGIPDSGVVWIPPVRTCKRCRSIGRGRALLHGGRVS